MAALATIPGSDVPGFMTVEELTWLYEMAQTVTSCLEVGSWKGRSTNALCAGCSNVVAVDTFKGTDGELYVESSDSLFAEFSENTKQYLGRGLSVLWGNAPDVAPLAPAVDLVFIDGAHDYASVSRDIRYFGPKARIVLCGHDWQLESVKQAVREFLDSQPIGKVLRTTVHGTIWAISFRRDEQTQ